MTLRTATSPSVKAAAISTGTEPRQLAPHGENPSLSFKSESAATSGFVTWNLFLHAAFLVPT
jgi:hypothetical protein